MDQQQTIIQAKEQIQKLQIKTKKDLQKLGFKKAIVDQFNRGVNGLLTYIKDNITNDVLQEQLNHIQTVFKITTPKVDYNEMSYEIGSYIEANMRKGTSLSRIKTVLSERNIQLLIYGQTELDDIIKRFALNMIEKRKTVLLVCNIYIIGLIDTNTPCITIDHDAKQIYYNQIPIISPEERHRVFTLKKEQIDVEQKEFKKNKYRQILQSEEQIQQNMDIKECCICCDMFQKTIKCRKVQCNLEYCLQCFKQMFKTQDFAQCCCDFPFSSQDIINLSFNYYDSDYKNELKNKMFRSSLAQVAAFKDQYEIQKQMKQERQIRSEFRQLIHGVYDKLYVIFELYNFIPDQTINVEECYIIVHDMKGFKSKSNRASHDLRDTDLTIDFINENRQKMIELQEYIRQNNVSRKWCFDTMGKIQELVQDHVLNRPQPVFEESKGQQSVNYTLDKYFKRCEINDCHGLIRRFNGKCTQCKEQYCNICLIHVTQSMDEHKCKEEDIKVVTDIVSNCKMCPKCNSLIFRSSGCNTMFCTQCNTGFDWATGRIIQSENFHNPHYTDYLRKIGKNINITLNTINCFEFSFTDQTMLQFLSGEIPQIRLVTTYKYSNQMDSNKMKRSMNLYKMALECSNYRSRSVTENGIMQSFAQENVKEKEYKTQLWKRYRQQEFNTRLIEIQEGMMMIMRYTMQEHIENNCQNDVYNDQIELEIKRTNSKLIELKNIYDYTIPYMDLEMIQTYTI